MHTDTQASQSEFLSWKHTSYANTPTCTHFHTHRDTFQTQNLLKNTISSPCVPRWSWQWERNTVHENCWTLWISLCICGRAVEEEDDTQCHQQQKVESHCQNHNKWRAGTSGRSVCVCVCVFCWYFGSASLVIIARTHSLPNFFPLPLYFANAEQQASTIVFSTLLYIF